MAPDARRAEALIPIAFGWNKTEALCPAEAEVKWPDESPLADVLGPAHPPDIVADVDVEEARYRWRLLPEPGTRA